MRHGVGAVLVAGVFVLGLSAGTSLGGRTSPGSNGRPVLDIVFTGGGKATFGSSGPQASNVKSARIQMDWTLRWHTDLGAQGPMDYLSEQLAAGDIKGTSSLEYYPGYGKPCDGPVRANTTVYGKEPWRSSNGVPGRTALPVPIEFGSAAEPCWSYNGGGTFWFAMDDGTVAPGLAASERNLTALLPATVFTDPQAARYAVTGKLDKTYPVTAGSQTLGTVRKTIQWAGDVYIRVNGLGPKPGNAPPPPQATTPTTTTVPGVPRSKPTAPAATWGPWLKRWFGDPMGALGRWIKRRSVGRPIVWDGFPKREWKIVGTGVTTFMTSYRDAYEKATREGEARGYTPWDYAWNNPGNALSRPPSLQEPPGVPAAGPYSAGLQVSISTSPDVGGGTFPLTSSWRARGTIGLQGIRLLTDAAPLEVRVTVQLVGAANRVGITVPYRISR